MFVAIRNMGADVLFLAWDESPELIRVSCKVGCSGRLALMRTIFISPIVGAVLGVAACVRFGDTYQKAPEVRQAGAVTTADWRPYNRGVTFLREEGRQIVRVDARPDDGVVWLAGAQIKEGTIEADLRGKDVQGQSFIGIAFRGVDNTHYDAIYFRPFNFRTPDKERVLRAIQYISVPTFTWSKLRSDSPGKYEKPISPIPEPNEWFRVRITLEGKVIKAYVNDSAIPTLTVTALSEPRDGMVGLYVGNESDGDFANLRVVRTR